MSYKRWIALGISAWALAAPAGALATDVLPPSTAPTDVEQTQYANENETKQGSIVIAPQTNASPAVGGVAVIGNGGNAHTENEQTAVGNSNTTVQYAQQSQNAGSSSGGDVEQKQYANENETKQGSVVIAPQTNASPAVGGVAVIGNGGNAHTENEQTAVGNENTTVQYAKQSQNASSSSYPAWSGSCNYEAKCSQPRHGIEQKQHANENETKQGSIVVAPQTNASPASSGGLVRGSSLIAPPNDGYGGSGGNASTESEQTAVGNSNTTVQYAKQSQNASSSGGGGGIEQKQYANENKTKQGSIVIAPQTNASPASSGDFFTRSSLIAPPNDGYGGGGGNASTESEQTAVGNENTTVQYAKQSQNASSGSYPTWSGGCKYQANCSQPGNGIEQKQYANENKTKQGSIVIAPQTNASPANSGGLVMWPALTGPPNGRYGGGNGNASTENKQTAVGNSNTTVQYAKQTQNAASTAIQWCRSVI